MVEQKATTGFKQTEVGMIPDDWEVRPIKELSSLMTNGFVGPVKSHYTDYDNGVLYIQGYNVEENSFNFNGIKRVTTEFHQKHSKSSLQEGDLLTIQTGDIGITTVVPQELEGSNCHALIITRLLKKNAEPKFFSYYFNSSIGRKRLKEIETGSTMKHINVGDMKYMLLPYPTLTEQTAIATALSDTDALIATLEKLIAKKQAIKQGAMQELLRPKEGWEVKKLGEVVQISKGQMITEKTATPGSIPVIGGGMTISYYHDKPNRTVTTITISASGAYAGYVSIHNSPIFASDCSTISHSKEFDIYFLYFTLLEKQREIYNLQTGGGQPHVYPQQLRNLEIHIPKEKHEQTRIARILSDMDAEIEALEKKLEKYRLLKQGMMQVLLTGKIRLA